MCDATATASPTGTLVSAGKRSWDVIAGLVFSDVDALLALERELLEEAPTASGQTPHQNIFSSHLSTLAKRTRC
jgi:hypothetical protein